MSAEFGKVSILAAATYNSEPIRDFLSEHGIQIEKVYVRAILAALFLYFALQWIRAVAITQLLKYQGQLQSQRHHLKRKILFYIC